MQPLPLALARADAKLGLQHVRRTFSVRTSACVRDTVLGMDARDELGAERDRRRVRVPEEAHPAVARGELAALGVEVEFGEVAAVECELEPFLGMPERALGGALLGDIAAHATVADEGCRYRRSATGRR